MQRFKALLIGASDYDAPGLPPLPFVRADLERLADALRSRGFETVDVAESPRGVTPNFVEGKISRLLSGAGRHDVLLIALSGHGVHIDGADYLLPEDADLDIVDRTGIKIDWARDLENTLAERVVFLIDACREGVDLGTMSSSNRRWGKRKIRAALQRKVAYVYACSPAQLALYVRNDEAIEDSAAIEAVPGDSFSLFSRAAADVVSEQPQVSSLDDLEAAIQRRIEKLHRAYAKKRSLQTVRVLTDVDKRDFHVLPTPPASASEPSRAASQQEESTITKLLATAGLGQVEILKDVDLPLSSMRATLVLAGQHPVTKDSSYVVVELKDWASVQPYEDSSTLCQVDGETDPTLNPAEEVRGYSHYLAAFNGTLFGHSEQITGATFLPNATESSASGLLGTDQSNRAMVFTGDDQDRFIDFLRHRFAPLPGTRAAAALLAGKPRPSMQLMRSAVDEVRNEEQFILLNRQRLAYELVLNAVRKTKGTGRKEVVIVTGGPGSGKSVIALSLLGELDRKGHVVAHATGSQSFTTTMRKVVGFRSPRVRGLFKYFNSFMASAPNELDVLICDEAHRLRETSANRFTRAAHRTGKPQIEELLDVARVPVFLLDEHQVVRPGETGTVADIRAAATARGLTSHVVSLTDQFRCGGSEAYLQWVVRLLELVPGGPIPWEPDGKVTLRVADSPEELESWLIARRSEEYNARISAGYCWPWTKKIPPGHDLPEDVVIGNWSRPWNVSGDKSVAGAPPSALWATDPAGFGQVGCVYTAQGFEYDWSGVILGPDLVWRTDRWVANRSASKDPAFKKSTPDEDVDQLIRNTYKVLLTRGMVGTVIYSTDPETRAKLRELVSPTENDPNPA